MKNLLILVSLVFTAHTSQAQNISKRIATAADILASISEGSNMYTVKAGAPKAMLLEFGLNEQIVESEEDFEASWKGLSGNAWEADSMNWGLENLSGAQSYITNALDQALENGEQTDADKVKFADGLLKVKKAFNILKSIKSVKFGVAPTGAVQCGVTFPSLLILDTENGKIHQIIMEGSGC